MDKHYRKISLALGVFLAGILLLSIPVANSYFANAAPVWTEFLEDAYKLFVILMSVVVGVFFGNERNGNHNHTEKDAE